MWHEELPAYLTRHRGGVVHMPGLLFPRSQNLYGVRNLVTSKDARPWHCGNNARTTCVPSSTSIPYGRGVSGDAVVGDLGLHCFGASGVGVVCVCVSVWVGGGFTIFPRSPGSACMATLASLGRVAPLCTLGQNLAHCPKTILEAG